MELITLSGRNKYDEIKALLINDKFTDLNATDQCGNTILIYAAVDNKPEIVELLLQKGANPNILNNSNYTALIYMCNKDYNNIEIAQILIKHGANLDILCDRHNTALIVASYNGNTEIVRLLVDAGANVHIHNISGHDALYYAANDEIRKIITQVIDHDAPYSAVYKLSNNMTYSEVKQAINRIENFDAANRWCNKLLIWAIQSKNLKLVKFLLKKNVSPNVYWICNISGLALCASHFDTKIAELLIRYGANLNSKSKIGNTALISAVKKSNIEMVRLLISAGADVSIQNCHGLDALHHARNKPGIYGIINKSKLCRAVYLNDTFPTINVSIKANDIWIKVWHNKLWLAEKISLNNDIQVSIDTNNKIEYHVMIIDGIESYVKFPVDLMGPIYRIC